MPATLLLIIRINRCIAYNCNLHISKLFIHMIIDILLNLLVLLKIEI